jgi:glutathione S-transferase
MTETIVLYGFGDSDRSGKVRWLARELGLEIDERKVELGAHRKAPYIELNPLAQIPTVVFRGETLLESTAACQFVAEAFDEPKLWIGPREPRRREYLFWMSAFTESLEGRLVETILSRPGLVDPRFAELHGPRVRPKLDTLVSMLPGDGYLCGDFSVADVVAGYGLRLALGCDLVDWARVAGYVTRLASRPASQKARFFGRIQSHLDAGL